MSPESPCIVLATALKSTYRFWYGGHCFGPRYFTEVEGPILLLLGAALEAAGRRLGVAALCLALILPYSVFIEIMGTYSGATANWNAFPANVDRYPARLWDWQDNPIFRGLRGERAGS